MAEALLAVDGGLTVTTAVVFDAAGKSSRDAPSKPSTAM